MRIITALLIFFASLIIIHFSLMNLVNADTRFKANYTCNDVSRRCVDSGEKEIAGLKVSRDCWQWSYVKKCNSPSKNNCAQHSRCYSLGRRECLLQDNYGSCINWLKEFSCKRWLPTYVESDHIRYGVEEKDGQEGLVCKGIPCIDGNCIDKSYEMDEEMMQSVSQLHALSQGESDGYNFKIFEGGDRHCSKKAANYSNCCQVFPKGWGKKIGAKCTKDEKILSEQRQKNLCVYVGKRSNKTAGVTTLTKHHFCCFNNILEKTIQVQGRKQLGQNFGSGGSPNCRGLTLDELERIDWSKIDFSEVAAEIQQRMVLPKVGDVEMRVKDSLSGINDFDHKAPGHKSNKKAGVNAGVDTRGGDESYY